MLAECVLTVIAFVAKADTDEVVKEMPTIRQDIECEGRLFAVELHTSEPLADESGI